MSSASCQHQTDSGCTPDDGAAPLLQDYSESITIPPKITPLPKLQLFIAIFIQVAEPVTSTVIYPIVNDLIRSIGITHGDEKKTGYYVGIVESIFYAAECLTVVYWGRASDVIGRKPILLGGMVGLALSMLSFGLSKKYWMLLISRAAQGAFNGNVGVTKSVMAEITDATNAPQAFAFLPVAWSVGSTLGPAIGGGFVNLEIFGGVGFFRSFPYFLPCFVAALVPICAFTLAFVALKETAPLVVQRLKEREVNRDFSSAMGHQVSHPKHDTSNLLSSSGPFYGTSAYKDQETPASPASTTTRSSPCSPLPKPQEKPTFRSILIPQVLIPITNFAFLAFLDQCVLVLIPLIYSTPVEFGGLNLRPSQIGSILGVWGVINGFIQVFCFARVRRILGHRTTYITGIVGMGIVFAFFPILSALVTWDGGRVGWSVYIGIALQLTSYSFSYMSYACMFLYIAAAAPSRSALGTTNGLAQLTASGTRAIAPTAASSLFALSLTLRGGASITGGYMVYIVLNLIVAAAVFWSTRLPRELRQRDD